MNAPSHEHEFRASIQEDVFYPDHAPRVETPTFRATKTAGHARGDVCAITGHPDDLEYHHLFVEAAFTDAVDWTVMRGIGTGEITHLPMIDLETGLPYIDADGKPIMVPVSELLIGMIVAITKWRGFDWSAFDPSHPETFVDSRANMLPLNVKMHRHAGHGIHHLSLPLWIFQAFPRVPGFVFSADELANRHQAAP